MLPFELFITLKYLKAKSREKFISVITVFSIIAVSLSVLTLIVVIAVMKGFERDLKAKILNMNAHITINSNGMVADYDAVTEKIERIPGVVAASPFVYTEVMVRVGRRVTGAILRGIEPVQEARVTSINDYLVAGSMELLENEIVVGQEFCNQFHVWLGDEIIIISPTQSSGPFGMAPKAVRASIKGVFKCGMWDFDNKLMCMELKSAMRFVGLEDEVTAINVRVEGPDTASDVEKLILGRLGRKFRGATWQRLNENLFAALETERVVMFIILVTAIVIAAFNIASSLIMTVMEKTRDIGILKALGSTPLGIMKIFLYEGAFVGIIGTIGGVLAGNAIVAHMEGIENLVSKVIGRKVFDAKIYYLDHIPAHISSTDIAVISLCAVMISIIAALYPAWKAAQLNPIEAIRYE